MPPLARRREDIPLVIAHFLALNAAETGQRSIYPPEALELLATAEWPGNVRQLQNLVRQTAALSQTPIIPVELVQQSLGGAGNRLTSFDDARDEFTRGYLSQILQITGGNVSQAARLAKRNRTDFYKLLGRHQLVPKTSSSVDRARVPASHHAALTRGIRASSSSTVPASSSVGSAAINGRREIEGQRAVLHMRCAMYQLKPSTRPSVARAAFSAPRNGPNSSGTASSIASGTAMSRAMAGPERKAVATRIEMVGFEVVDDASERCQRHLARLAVHEAEEVGTCRKLDPLCAQARSGHRIRTQAGGADAIQLPATARQCARTLARSTTARDCWSPSSNKVTPPPL